MFNISSYLDKFKKIGVPEGMVKQAVIDSLAEVIGISIDKKEIKIQNKIAFIQTNPLVKNQIVIKKTALMEAVSKKTDKVTDIR